MHTKTYSKRLLMLKNESHAHLQIMKTNPAKVQNNSRKAVGGIAHTSHILKKSSDAEKRLNSQSEKM